MRYLCKLIPLCIALGVCTLIIAYYIWLLAYSGEDRSTGKKQQLTRIAAALGASVFAVFLSFSISYFKIYRNDGLRGVYKAFFEIEFYKSLLFAFLFSTVEIVLFRLLVTLKRKLPVSGAFAISGGSVFLRQRLSYACLPRLSLCVQAQRRITTQ